MPRQSRMRPTVICAWCSQLLSSGDGSVSHGICHECEQKVIQLAEEHWREAAARTAGSAIPAAG